MATRAASFETKKISYGLYGSRVEKLGYRAAQVERESGRPIAQGGSGDYHARWDRPQLVKQSQQFDRDNGIYEAVINRSIDNIIGDGFSLEAHTDNAKVNAGLERFWEEFCLDPEIQGRFPWWQVENLVARGLFVDGDIGAIKLDPAKTGGKLMLIESERLAYFKLSDGTNRVEQGISLSEYNRALKFWVADYSRYGIVQPQSAKPVDAENFVFIANIKRPSLTRGIPALTTNFPMFHRINDVCDSEAVAWQLLSRLAIAVIRKNAPTIANGLSTEDPAKALAPVQDLAQRIQDFDYGMIFQGEEGEEIKGIERNLPGANFSASVTMFLRLLGLPLGLPLELTLLDWSKTNYSSARAALEQAFRMFSRWQRLLMEKWHSPIYRWKVQQWIDEGKLPNRPDIFRHSWIAPSFPWIDQLKEAEAWGMRIDRGLSTHSEACKALNRDRDKITAARVREIINAIEETDAINKKYPGANVDWRLLCGLTAAGTSANGKPEQPAAGQEDGADNVDGGTTPAKE